MNKTKLEQVLEWYKPIVESRYPGKGSIAAEIIKQHWDDQADADCGSEVMKADGTMSLLKDGMQSAFVRIGQRKPAFANALRALKG